MNRPLAAPPTLAMLQKEHGRFLSTHHNCFCTTKCGDFQVSDLILDLGSFYVLEILRFKLLFKHPCIVKLFLVSSLFIRKINKVSWPVWATSGKTGIVSWSQALWGPC